jgi:hypothetical protein
MARKIYVHLGAQKTGTTAIQKTLFSAREALLEKGIHWLGRDNWYEGLHGAFTETPEAMTISPGGNSDEISKARDKTLGHLKEQIEASDAETFVISCESLNKLKATEMSALKEFFAQFGDVHAIYFYRHLTPWRASQSQHYAKTARRVDPISYREAAYTLREIPKRILSVFGEDLTHIMSFEKSAKAGICDSFLGLMNGPTLKELGHEEIRANESLTGPSTHMNYLMNALYPAGDPIRSKRVMDRIRRLEGPKYKGPALTQSEHESYTELFEANKTDLKLELEHPDDLRVSDSPEEAMIPVSSLKDLLEDYAQAVTQLNKVRKLSQKTMRISAPPRRAVQKVEPLKSAPAKAAPVTAEAPKVAPVQKAPAKTSTKASKRKRAPAKTSSKK